MKADASLKAMFATYTLRDLIIQMISDDYKDLHGFRPRWNWDSFTLVQLWAEHKRIYDDLLIELKEQRKMEYYGETDWDLYDELENWSYGQMEVADSVQPDQWDHEADRLEGVNDKPPKRQYY